MAQDGQNIIKLTITNMLIFLLLNSLITINASMVQGFDHTNPDVMDNLTDRIGSQLQGNGTVFLNYISLNVSDIEQGGQQRANILSDLFESVTNGVKIIAKVTLFAFNAQFPATMLWSTSLPYLAEGMVRGLFYLFILIWQGIIFYQWSKLIIGLRLKV